MTAVALFAAATFALCSADDYRLMAFVGIVVAVYAAVTVVFVSPKLSPSSSSSSSSPLRLAAPEVGACWEVPMAVGEPTLADRPEMAWREVEVADGCA
ncbi:hypothetical protein OsJ_17263 [Oryza sativa Japonica Group]|uniref:Uncharacterized protein n=1 Tax=Oryza sativa subsp. japonica TaxID=39947 RepID=B9FMN7_ORYSJ|nr:hypothetical protein OsJ_17263 [Oryza sativa Japonica Group]